MQQSEGLALKARTETIKAQLRAACAGASSLSASDGGDSAQSQRQYRNKLHRSGGDKLRQDRALCNSLVALSFLARLGSSTSVTSVTIEGDHYKDSHRPANVIATLKNDEHATITGRRTTSAIVIMVPSRLLREKRSTISRHTPCTCFCARFQGIFDDHDCAGH